MPMKPSEATVRMAKPMSSDILTMIGDMTFGRMWRRRIRRGAGAERPRGRDEHLLLLRHHLAAHEPRIARPPGQRDRDHHVDDAGPERRGDRHGEDQARNGQLEVGEAHQDLVGPAAEIAGDGADERADQRADHAPRRSPASSETRGAGDHQRQHVLAELVGAEQVRAPTAAGTAPRCRRRRRRARDRARATVPKTATKSTSDDHDQRRRSTAGSGGSGRARGASRSLPAGRGAAAAVGEVGHA